MVIDSASVGDPATFLSLDVLERQLAALPPAPRDAGRVVYLIRRVEGGRREILDRVPLSVDGGLPGDAWGRQRKPAVDAQLTVMQFNVAQLIANGQPLTLFGDNLVFDLDLSTENLPIGSRVRAGAATLEVSPMPHTGCRKFRARFGLDAQQMTSKPELRHLRLRGVYMRVVEGGDIAAGDVIEVLSRGAAVEPEGDSKE